MATVCIPFRGCSVEHPWTNSWRGGIRNTNTGFFIWQLNPSGKLINPYIGKCAGLNGNGCHGLIYWNVWSLRKNWEVWSCLGSCVTGETLRFQESILSQSSLNQSPVSLCLLSQRWALSYCSSTLSTYLLPCRPQIHPLKLKPPINSSTSSLGHGVTSQQ